MTFTPAQEKVIAQLSAILEQFDEKTAVIEETSNFIMFCTKVGQMTKKKGTNVTLYALYRASTEDDKDNISVSNIGDLADAFAKSATN